MKPRLNTAAAEGRERHSRSEVIVALLDRAVAAASAPEPSEATLRRDQKALAMRVADALRLGPVELSVGPFGFSAGGRPIHDPGGRVAYVFQLFIDGVRGLVFTDEVTPRALGRLIQLLAAEPPHGDDRVTWLWRQGLPGIRFQAVDVLLSDFEHSRDGELRLAQEFGQVRVRRAGSGSDPNEIIMLPPDDMRVLRGTGRLDWIADTTVPSTGGREVRGLTQEIRGSADGRTDWPRFMLHVMQAARLVPADRGPAPLLGGLIDALVAERRDEDLAAMLRALARYDSTEAVEIRRRVLTRERLASMAPAAERDPHALTEPLQCMAADLGGNLSDLVMAVRRPRAEERMFALARGVGDELAVPCYVRQLTGTDIEAALKAVAALARSEDPAALVGLGRALEQPAPALRRAAVRALGGRYHPELREALVRALKDKEKANRLGVLAVLRDSGDTRVVLPVLTIVRGDDFGKRDPDERKAFYRALVLLGDVRGWSHLASVLEGRRSGRIKPSAEDQMLVVKALGRAGPRPLRAMLQEASRRRSVPRAARKVAAEALVYWRTP